MTQKDYVEFSRSMLGIDFKDIELLVMALTHRSYLNEHRKSANEHNERLEFLGDAVLELVVTKFLYLNHDQPEGILTNWRSALVRTESIAAAGKKLEIDKYLRLSRGEKQGSERARQQILANAYEAVIGAIYLDAGFKSAENFIKRTLLVTLDDILAEGTWLDPKSVLQERVQSDEALTPAYKVLSEEGPDHEKTFTVGVFIGERLCGKGQGPSKQIAQQQAAKKALRNYGS